MSIVRSAFDPTRPSAGPGSATCWHRPPMHLPSSSPGGNLFAVPQIGPVSSTSGGLCAAEETSPSLVYGAALLMRLGS